MKPLRFTLSLLAFLFVSVLALQAQGGVAKSGMSPFDAYKANFTNAVNQGDLQMVDPHRMKLVSFMDREIGLLEAAPDASSKSTQQDIARLKEIRDAFRAMDVATTSDLNAVKKELSKLDEFATIKDKHKVATN